MRTHPDNCDVLDAVLEALLLVLGISGCHVEGMCVLRTWRRTIG